MFLPSDFFWLELPLIGAAVVFFIDLIGNMISFNNRILNALTTALVFLLVFGAINYINYREGNLPPTPAVVQPSP